MAEREGFEPSIREHRIHTFQACAFNRSATSPTFSRRALYVLRRVREAADCGDADGWVRVAHKSLAY